MSKPHQEPLHVTILHTSIMKVLILAAGYGTRLARDLERTGECPELKGVPKPLLPIAGQPLISHWMKIIRSCPRTHDAEVYIVVNVTNQAQFQEWAKDYSGVQLVCDGSTSNEERLGAVACIELPVRHFAIDDHLIVIGGDTLFFEDFNLDKIVERFETCSCIEQGGAVIICYQCQDADTVKVGILEVDEDGRVTSFLEKPSPDSTSSRNACPCFYVLSGKSLPMLGQFLDDMKNEPLDRKDATGHFVRYLCSKRSVYTYNVSGRFDVGNLESYRHCNANYK